MSAPADTLDLWDYRRRVHAMYALVRDGGGAEARTRWAHDRDRLFGHHPQSPLDAAQRVLFEGLDYHPYDATWRYEVQVEPVAEGEELLGHSGAGQTAFRRFASASFHRDGIEHRLTLYWLEAYGGGVFLPFRDTTNGDTSYGGGRYLLDTVKGADLGHVGDVVVLDFNYAYHPSCTYNPMWSCPLAPPENRLDLAVTAGERLIEL